MHRVCESHGFGCCTWKDAHALSTEDQLGRRDLEHLRKRLQDCVKRLFLYMSVVRGTVLWWCVREESALDF